MMKKIIIWCAIFLCIVAAVAYICRYQILQHSIDAIVRNSLPAYVKIDAVRIDVKSGKIVLAGLKVLNPEPFSRKYLLEVRDLSFGYKVMGSTILDGIEVEDVVMHSPVLVVERTRDGLINLNEFQKVLKQAAEKAESKKAAGSSKVRLASAVSGSKQSIQMVKLPETVSVKDGKMLIIDAFVISTGSHMITLENIEATVSIKFNSSYTQMLKVASKGQGCLNGHREEVLGWTTSLDPTAQNLTMANRLDASGLDIMPFRPYYDKYSPFVFERGKFTGTLIFDFDNGNIGSTNEIHLKDLSFKVKEGYENAQFWGTTVQDLAKYFTSSFGEVIFDFKIKGPMSDPRFYLGPISKKAVTSMVIDTISSAIQQAGGPTGEQSPVPAGKSDIEKAKEYIDLFKGLIKKE